MSLHKVIGNFRYANQKTIYDICVKYVTPLKALVIYSPTIGILAGMHNIATSRDFAVSIGGEWVSKDEKLFKPAIEEVLKTRHYTNITFKKFSLKKLISKALVEEI